LTAIVVKFGRRRGRADSSIGNNIFEPKESPDMKEGEKKDEK
jgi:hypothetical protein